MENSCHLQTKLFMVFYMQQVCVPVVIIPPASVAATRCQSRGGDVSVQVGLCPKGGVSVQRGVSQRGVSMSKGGCFCSNGGVQRGDPSPHVDRMTDPSENTTLPQTSFAGGKYLMKRRWITS